MSETTSDHLMVSFVSLLKMHMKTRFPQNWCELFDAR